MTSMRRSSNCSGRAMSRSRIRTFVETRPPASRQTLAAALSSAKPRRPSTPTLAHAVAKDVEWTATPEGTQSGGAKGARGDGEGAPQDLGVEARVEGRRTTHEGQTSHGSSLDLNMALSSWEPRPHRCGQKEILHLFGCFTLPPMSRHPRASVFHVTSTGSLALCQRCPTGRVETNIRKSAFGLDQSREMK